MIVTPVTLAATGEAEQPAVGNALPVRVIGGIPGEAAEVRLVHRGGQHVYTQWVGAAAPSPDRVDVACPHVGTCGGCSWLHMRPGRQHVERTQRVQRALAAVGLDLPVEARPAPPNEGRHIVKLVAADTPGGVRFGAYKPRSHEVGRIPGCLALSPRLRPLTDLPPLRLPPGVARHLVARASSHDGRVLATLVVYRDHPAIRDLEPVLRRAGVDGLAIHRNDRPGDGILDPAGATVPLWGLRALREAVAADTLVEVGPTSFFQTNPAVGRQIWAELPEPDAAVVDLYAGVGSASFALWAQARAAGRNVGILGTETHAGAVTHARHTAARLGADARFEVAEAGDGLPDRLDGATVVLNPPRKGTGPRVREQVLARGPARVVHISCHPEPLARDLAAWASAGWRPASVRTYDMFPGTPHVETVAVLEPG